MAAMVVVIDAVMVAGDGISVVNSA